LHLAHPTRIVATMTSQTLPADQVRRFMIEDRPVRGHWVCLEQAWQGLRAHKEYPEPVRELLGQTLTAAVLLAASLKFDGTLTLQLRGTGAVSLLVAQCTHDFGVRAVAHCDEAAVAAVMANAAGEGIFRALVGVEGRMVVSIETAGTGQRYQAQRYQGIVPLAGDCLAQSLESYFATSEQLPTRVVLAADSQRSVGLLLQKLPDPAQAEPARTLAAWQEAQSGLRALRGTDLLRRPVEELLALGFPSCDIRLFKAAPVRFECRCNPSRVSNVLRALGVKEVREVLQEQGAVTVTCEFCQRPYRFDAVDVEALFAEGVGKGSNGSILVH
jgi:molecular chaperone Hsp33